MKQKVYLKDVVTLQLDAEKCDGCGQCLIVCPHAVLVRANGRVAIDNRDACMECGACARNCQAEAIRVEAGVGCAQAVLNTMLGRYGSSCCGVIESSQAVSTGSSCDSGGGAGGSACC
jgi:NAD-dependent dihydropyrimidine dehydrogenase PreA subunit